MEVEHNNDVHRHVLSNHVLFIIHTGLKIGFKLEHIKIQRHSVERHPRFKDTQLKDSDTDSKTLKIQDSKTLN